MNRDFQIRFTAGFLVLLTAAAVTLGWINFRKERQSGSLAPYDGVWWIEREGKIVAERVDPRGPGAQAGIRRGDRVAAIDSRPVTSIAVLVSQMYHDGVWSKPNYTLQRGQFTFDASPVLSPSDRSSNAWLRLIALIYLAIGLYVLFRRWTAPGSTHFYVFCVTSFVLYASKEQNLFKGGADQWRYQPFIRR